MTIKLDLAAYGMKYWYNASHLKRKHGIESVSHKTDLS